MRDMVRQQTGFASPTRLNDDRSEQRSAQRVAILIRTVKLITPRGEFLCVMRDASETGASLRIFHRLPHAGSMVLEMPNGDQHPLDLVWQTADRAGVEFHHPTNLARLLENHSRFAKRPIRVNCSAPATISCLAGSFAATVTNLSQQGAQIECAQRLAIDQRVRLQAEGLPEVKATVRWRGDGVYGLAFEDTFQFGDLARTVADIHLGSVARRAE
jgi:hypothetical protein